MEKEERYYIINKRNEVEKLAYSDIFYMKKEGKYVIFVHRRGEVKIRASLSTVEKELNSKEFIISDRGYLANIQHVMKMKGRDYLCIVINVVKRWGMLIIVLIVGQN